MRIKKEWDVFVSHANADKGAFVLPLAEELRAAGLRVWLDHWEIDLGARISSSIEAGLQRSRFGIVVLSKAFFKKRAWPKTELGAFFAKETTDAQYIIPIWYNIKYEEVVKKAPLLADRMAALSEEGIPAIVQRVCRLVRHDGKPRSLFTNEAVVAFTRKLFPNLGVDAFWQARLLADLDTAMYRSFDDIERAVHRARFAVKAYAKERPETFRTGTDYITKSLGFVDLCFRSRHGWSHLTRDAFKRHEGKIVWGD